MAGKERPIVNTLVPTKYRDLRGKEITLTLQDVKTLLAKNQNVTDVEVMGFIRYCAHHEADPFANDAYLVKYDEKAPASYVLGIGHFNKLAVSDKDYAGIESGIIVKKGAELEYRDGTLFFPADGEELVGGWAKAYNKQFPERPTYKSVALATYLETKWDHDQKKRVPRARWAKDPAGMINKVAISQAKREAFPRKLSDAYVAEEIQEAPVDVMPSEVATLTEEETEVMELSNAAKIIEQDKSFTFTIEELKTYMVPVAQGMKLTLLEALARFQTSVSDENGLKKFTKHFKEWLTKHRPAGEPDQSPEDDLDMGGPPETTEEPASADEKNKKIGELRKKIVGARQKTLYLTWANKTGLDLDREYSLAMDIEAGGQEAFDGFLKDLQVWASKLKKSEKDAMENERTGLFGK